MYVMMTILSEARKLKAVLEALKGIDVRGSIVLNAQGTNSLQKSYPGFKPILESSLISISEKTNYKKAIISFVEDDDRVKLAMDAIEKAVGCDIKKPNSAFIFTTPIVGMVEGNELDQDTPIILEDFDDEIE